MGFPKEDNEKEYLCKQCNTFLEAKDLIGTNCPECNSDEFIFPNELLTEQEEKDGEDEHPDYLYE